MKKKINRGSQRKIWTGRETKISELEYNSVEIIQSNEQTDKKNEGRCKGPQRPAGHHQEYQHLDNAISREEMRKKGPKRIFEDLMAKASRIDEKY